MKIINSILTAFIILLSANSNALEIYAFDPSHSYITWHVSHFGYSQLSGKFFVTGTISLDENNPNESRVNAIIDTSHVNTGIPKLDSILEGPDFFDSANYPKATFVSRRVIVVNNTHAKIDGILTIRGISKPVTLSVKLTQMGIHPFFKKKAVGFEGSTAIDRSKYNIDKYLPGVGDKVTIEIESEAFLHASY